MIQERLIERACQLQLRIALMDRKFARDGTQSEHDSRTYLAWSNSLTCTLRELGERTEAKKPALAALDWSDLHAGLDAA